MNDQFIRKDGLSVEIQAILTRSSDHKAYKYLCQIQLPSSIIEQAAEAAAAVLIAFELGYRMSGEPEE